MPPIPLHLLLLAVAGFITLILLLLALLAAARSRPSNDPNDDPRCGACGCILAHPQDGICPTCRSPLNAVGLVLPFSKKRTSGFTSRQAFYKVTAFPLALWTIFITGLATGGTYAIDQWVLPYNWQTISTLQARPRSTALQSIVITTVEECRARGRVQFDSPSATKTTRIEFKTDDAAHILDIDLLAPAFSYHDAEEKPIIHDGLPTKNDLLSFMHDRNLPTDAGAAQDAAILASMLAKLAPGSNLIGSAESRSSNLTTLTLNGGQWKTAIPLQTLSLWISPTLWFLGLILIIWIQRHRRAQVKAILLTPPLPPISHDQFATDSDAAGGWDITLDPKNPFPNLRPSPQLPTARQ